MNVETTILRILHSQLSLDEGYIQMDDSLDDLNMDERDILEAFTEIEEESGVEIPYSPEDGLTTVEQVIEYVEENV